jgi:hypothetical protein
VVAESGRSLLYSFLTHPEWKFALAYDLSRAAPTCLLFLRALSLCVHLSVPPLYYEGLRMCERALLRSVVVQNKYREMQQKKGIVEMVLRAQCEDIPYKSYSCQNGARPKECCEGLQILTSQNPVGLSARDGYVIGAVEYNSLSGGAWDEGLVAHLSLADDDPGWSQFPGVHGRSRLLTPPSRRRLGQQAHWVACACTIGLVAFSTP